MFNIIKAALYPQRYIWIDVLLIKETRKAILVVFDGKEIWLPKTWILWIKLGKKQAAFIRISEYPLGEEGIKLSFWAPNWQRI